MKTRGNIPKIIHYCWFGRGNMPESAKRFIETWKKYCPDYEIKEWNEDNFDIHSNVYVEEAYNSKKYAFVTDYVRLYALYNEGGIYMDTDVEVLHNLDQFLTNHAFSGFEDNNMIPTGIMGAEKGNRWIKDLLNEYNDLHFIKNDGTYDLTTNVIRITNLTEQKYDLKKVSSYQELKYGIVTMYPYDYFCPKSQKTGVIHLTNNSYTIHHFSGSWVPEKVKKREQYRSKKISEYIDSYIEKGIEKEKAENMALRKFRIRYFIVHPFQLIQKIKDRCKKK